jgi:hypothetical protein
MPEYTNYWVLVRESRFAAVPGVYAFTVNQRTVVRG